MKTGIFKKTKKRKNRFLDAELFSALDAYDFDCAAKLIQAGADINMKDSDGTPLLTLVIAEENSEFAGELIRKGADVESKDAEGIAPAAAAVIMGCNKILQMLLEKGADPEGRVKRLPGKIKWGRKSACLENGIGIIGNLITLAANRCNTEAIDILLKYGAKTDQRGISGFTPLMALITCIDGPRMKYGEGRAETGAKRQSSSQADIKEAYVKTVRFLVDKGAGVNAANSSGYTPLMLASVNTGADEVIDILLKNGADPAAKNSDMETVLSGAVKRGAGLEIITKLIFAGAEANIGNKAAQRILEKKLSVLEIPRVKRLSAESREKTGVRN